MSRSEVSVKVSSSAANKIKDHSERVTYHWATEPVEINGQYNEQEGALTQVVAAVPVESFGQSEIYFSLRSVTVCFEQTRMNCTKPTA